MELESKDHKKREKQEKRSEWEVYGEVTLFQFCACVIGKMRVKLTAQLMCT
jgi:hypothetical protein